MTDVQISIDTYSQNAQALKSQYLSAKQANEQQAETCSQSQGNLLAWLSCMPDVSVEQSLKSELENSESKVSSLQDQLNHLEAANDTNSGLFVSCLIGGTLLSGLSWFIFAISANRRPKQNLL